MKIISVYPNFKIRGGAEDISITLAKKLNSDTPIILTNPSFDYIHADYKDKGIKYESFNISNIIKYRNGGALFLSHHRKLTTILMLLNKFLRKKIFIIHVAHNIFYNLKCFTLFPENIIAVSNGVKDNLIGYFKINQNRINVIFNGVEDAADKSIVNYKTNSCQIIKILLIGRLCQVKQQLEIVKRTKGLLDKKIEFYFAGEGPILNELEKEIGKCKQYKLLGHINVKNEIYKYDYICLFSKVEGLGIALIEGCMFGKPLITNNLKSVMDVNINGYNGFVVKNWNEFISCINTLHSLGTEKYIEMSLNSRKQYEDYFTIDKMILNYKNYFDGLHYAN